MLRNDEMTLGQTLLAALGGVAAFLIFWGACVVVLSFGG
jgi:hypothetical protein